MVWPPRWWTCARCARSTSPRCWTPSRRPTGSSPWRRGRGRAAGLRACSARSPKRLCTISTTPGSSRRTRRPCRTARRSRTRSSPTPRRSSNRCVPASARGSPDGAVRRGVISAPAGRAAAWLPLRHPAFRLVWLTFLCVQLANWSETVGAVAVIAAQSGSAALLALVQTASTLPAVAVALPAGAAADLVDRRKLLVTLVGSMCASMALLAAAVATGTASPAVVLLGTLILGSAIALAIPAFASLIPDLVPPEDLAPAVTLNGISINLARALGPALAGIVLALTTAAALFVLLAAALAAMALLLLATPRAVGAPSGTENGWRAAMRSGVRFARSSAALQAVLARGFAFVVPASALWALLPAVAVQQLELSSAAF